MDKRRLMELAGVTEASYINQRIYVIVGENMGAGGESSEFPEVFGPFQSERDAQEYLDRKINKKFPAARLVVEEVKNPDSYGEEWV